MKRVAGLVGSWLVLGALSWGAAEEEAPASYVPDLRFRLETGLYEGQLAYVGRGGDIDGKVNPVLRVPAGSVVQLTVVNGEGLHHELVLPDFSVVSDFLPTEGAASVVVFRATDPGEFEYFCDGPGHREAGLAGRVIVEPTGDGVASAAP